IDLSHFENKSAFDLIFYPGFSTAASETETSGRGIGMSAIQNYIDDLNGKIKIESVLGQSLKISLYIPIISDKSE
ncbi:MAG: hypothetical protein Q7U04_02890, partial [Bacteriovorax sp.]|nr:hypothetical protein [Bacteriovorax sp.]